jgi:hypothetical protein
MKMLRWFWIVVIAIMVAEPVFADTLDCGGSGVVITGDLEEDVLRKCGEPTYTEDNQWVYDMGDPDTLTVIHFGGGGKYRREVIRIERVKR